MPSVRRRILPLVALASAAVLLTGCLGADGPPPTELRQLEVENWDDDGHDVAVRYVRGDRIVFNRSVTLGPGESAALDVPSGPYETGRLHVLVDNATFRSGSESHYSTAYAIGQHPTSCLRLIANIGSPGGDESGLSLSQYIECPEETHTSTPTTERTYDPRERPEVARTIGR